MISNFPGALWTNRHKDTRTGIRADEVEFRALKEGTASLTEALRDERINGTTSEENSIGVANKWHRRTEVADDQMAHISLELRRRSEQLGAAWPFMLDGVTLRQTRESPSLVYEFCLSISRAPSIVRKPFDTLPAVFESASLSILKEWLGKSATGLRTGWPRSQDLPTKCKDLFSQIQARADCQHEWRWAPDPYLPEDPSPNELKEAKLDLLAWLQIPGGQGQVYFAGQCACGSDNDMEDKARELTVAGIMRWVKPPSFVPLVRCFFVPFVLPPNRLMDIINIGGATFDRTRLCQIASNMNAKNMRNLKAMLKPSVDLVIRA